jgi:hypothetical protein
MNSVEVSIIEVSSLYITIHSSCLSVCLSIPSCVGAVVQNEQNQKEECKHRRVIITCQSSTWGWCGQLSKAVSKTAWVSECIRPRANWISGESADELWQLCKYVNAHAGNLFHIYRILL